MTPKVQQRQSIKLQSDHDLLFISKNKVIMQGIYELSRDVLN